MKKTLIKSLWLVAGLTSVMMSSAVASPEQERVYLLQLIHQIDAMQPTLLAARKEQSPDARVQFHYDALWEDLKKIQSGIQEKLNPISIEPRTVPPISGDYLADAHSKEDKSS